MGCCSSEPPKKTVPLRPSTDDHKTPDKTAHTLKYNARSQNKKTDPTTPPESQNGPPSPNAAKITALANSATNVNPPPDDTQNEVKSSNTDKEDVGAMFASVETIVASFSGLYDIYNMYCDGDKMMDKEGLTAALNVFGLKIDKNPDLQKLIWDRFDLEGANQIDYNDFSATLSAMIDSKNDDSLFLFFQIFDYDENGFLEVDELAEMLFAQQKIAAAVTNQPELITESSNKACLRRAQTFVEENDDNGDGKISFEEYNKWRIEHAIVLPIKS